jgi:Ser/Thr protein kinase RdoA (MazF antagonist)
MEGITLYVSRRLEMLEREALVGTDLGKTLRKRLEEIETALLRSLPSVLLHGDFIPSNILIDGERVCVLDFSWVSRGCQYFDITAFALALRRLGDTGRYSRRTLSLLEEAFLEGYGGIRRESVEFRSFELVQRVHALEYLWGRRQKSGWARRMLLDYEIEQQLRWLREFRE